MKNKTTILFVLLAGLVQSQDNTFSPYSRYGVGELSQTTFAHNTGMAGASIAWRPDSLTPVFVNMGNPAALSLVRLTALEVGGRFIYSDFNANNSSLKKWSANFAYGALAFPIRSNGGAAFGIMPYSDVGYQAQSTEDLSGIGSVTNRYAGTGGLNKAFLGYGIMPFKDRLTKFRSKRQYIPDSLQRLSSGAFKFLEFGSKLLSDFSLGANANFIFGGIQNTARIVYPNSLLYNNTYRERVLTMNDFTGNFGAQTALTIDSVKSSSLRKARINSIVASLKESGLFTDAQIGAKADSLNKNYPTQRKALSEKVKFTFGYTGNIQNPMKVTYSSAVYNYILNSSGQELIRDTVLFNVNQAQTIVLPFEQGFGIGFKKGEKLNIVADFAITDWTTFKYLGSTSTDLLKNYRTSLGINFVPEKYAAGSGAFPRTINYRFGVSYQTGYISVNDKSVSDMFVSFGIGLPVGINRRSAMVNVSAQLGQMTSGDPTMLRQNYFRVNFGFTFCDKWFQKFRYD